MNETVAIIIATFGDDDWKHLASERAFPSALRQTRPPDEVIRSHSDTLARARNQAAESVETDWLIFLDADDELAPRYVEKMLEGAGDLRQPATIGIYPDGHMDDRAVVIPRKRLIDGNFMVIGTMCRRDQFLTVGGFHEWPLYEDWDLWLRLYLEGAEIVACPEAIYRIYVREDSRNNQIPLQMSTYKKIRAAHEKAFMAKGWQS